MFHKTENMKIFRSQRFLKLTIRILTEYSIKHRTRFTRFNVQQQLKTYILKYSTC